MTNMIDKKLQQFRPRPGYERTPVDEVERAGLKLIVLLLLCAALTVLSITALWWIVSTSAANTAHQLEMWRSIR